MKYFEFLRRLLLALLVVLAPVLAEVGSKISDEKELEGRYFAFIDYQFIFTLELTEQGVPIMNFVNLTDTTLELAPGHLLLSSPNKSIPVKSFQIETGVDGQWITAHIIKMRAHSSFGFTLKGDFSTVKRLESPIIKLMNESFVLKPLSKPEFDILAMKVNRINISSPDIHEDYRVLRIKPVGKRTKQESP